MRVQVNEAMVPGQPGSSDMDGVGAVEAEARDVLGADLEEIVPLAHGTRMEVTAGVWSVRAGDRQAVVKVVSPGTGDPRWRGSHGPRHSRYWRREPLLYEHGLPRPYLAAGVRAPALLANLRRPSGEVALWLEHISGVAGRHWDASTYRAAARRLGRAQGVYLCGEPYGDSRSGGTYPWSTDFLREFLASWDDVDWSLASADAGDLPQPAGGHFPQPLRAEMRALYAEQERFLNWLDQLPRVICHHDVWPNNAFDTGGETVLVDWVFAGIGPVGCDAGNLVADSCFDLLHPASLLPELDEATFTGYREGLRDAGWGGDERLVRLGMCAMAVKWTWVLPLTLERAGRRDHRVYGGDADAEHLYAERAAALSFLVGWAREARALERELRT